MNKISVVILSISILIQSFNIEFDDFSLMPDLINHIRCHFETGDSFSEFVSMHYGSDINKHEYEHNEHDKLPFKQDQLESHFQFVYTLCAENDIDYFNETLLSKDKFSYSESASKLFGNTLFQPPQK